MRSVGDGRALCLRHGVQANQEAVEGVDERPDLGRHRLLDMHDVERFGGPARERPRQPADRRESARHHVPHECKRRGKSSASGHSVRSAGSRCRFVTNDERLCNLRNDPGCSTPNTRQWYKKPSSETRPSGIGRSATS